MVPALTSKGQEGFPRARGFLANPYVSLASRLVLGATLLWAGAVKIGYPGGLAASIRSYGLPLPEWCVTFSAYLLPYLEVMFGLYLVAGLFTRIVAWTTSGLMLLFLAALVQGALRGLEIDCGCFGANAGASVGASAGAGAAGCSSLWLGAARDVGLLALGLQISLAPSGRFSVDALLGGNRPPEKFYEA